MNRYATGATAPANRSMHWKMIRRTIPTAHGLWRRILGLMLCATSVFLMRVVEEIMALPAFTAISSGQILRLFGTLLIGWLGATLFARCRPT
jgi:hypothetical protein